MNELHEQERATRLRQRILILGVLDERRRRREERQVRRQPRSCWMRDWIARRTDFGRCKLYITHVPNTYLTPTHAQLFACRQIAKSLTFFSFPHPGMCHRLYEFLDTHFQGDYRKYVGLDRELFNEVLRRVSPRIEKTRRCVYLIMSF